MTASMIVLMARWALPYSGMPSSDDEIQGQLALVTQPISASARGEIAFIAGGVRRTLAASGVQESEIPRDSEVVIDTIEDGVARVELWSTVKDVFSRTYTTTDVGRTLTQPDFWRRARYIVLNSNSARSSRI